MEWISTKERLPEVTQYGHVEVIVTTDRGEVMAMYYEIPRYATTARGKKPRWTRGNRISIWEVTHWMPLPAPASAQAEQPTEAQP